MQRVGCEVRPKRRSRGGQLGFILDGDQAREFVENESGGKKRNRRGLILPKQSYDME